MYSNMLLMIVMGIISYTERAMFHYYMYTCKYDLNCNHKAQWRETSLNTFIMRVDVAHSTVRCISVTTVGTKVLSYFPVGNRSQFLHRAWMKIVWNRKHCVLCDPLFLEHLHSFTDLQLHICCCHLQQEHCRKVGVCHEPTDRLPSEQSSHQTSCTLDPSHKLHICMHTCRHPQIQHTTVQCVHQNMHIYNFVYIYTTTMKA